MLARLLLLGGAASTAGSSLLPWVTVRGRLASSLDFGLIGARAGAGDRTVAGIDTTLWPLLVGIGVLVALLALLGIARRLLLVVGLVVTAAGVLLVIYMSNAVDVATRGDAPLARAAADALLSSSVGPGTPLLLGGGVAIAAGALLRG